MAQVVKKYGFCLFSPIATCGVLFIIFAIYHLFPLGENTLSWCDMNQQVLPILLDFKNILSGQSDLFLNMSNAGGMNFWGVFLFFISSPFSFLIIFIDPLDIYLFANILVMLKMATCAFTASLFFRIKFSNFDILQNIAFSLMYAFCGYTMMYYQNVVWLDMMYLFPILLIGFHSLVQKQKILLFVLSFSMVMAVNFYLTYMVVIFLILSFFLYIYLCVPKEKRKKIILLMTISTIIVALITAIFWLPSLLQYLDSARTVGLLQSLSSGNFFTTLTTTLPVLLCNAIILSIVPLVSLNRKIKNKRIKYLFILLFFTVLPVFIEPINKMWHTGSYQAFPVRYGYIPVFIALILVAIFISERNKDLLYSFFKKNIIFIVVAIVITIGVAFLSSLFFCKDINLFGKMNSYVTTLWMNHEDFGYFLIFVVVAGFVYLGLLFFYWYRLLPRFIFSILLCITVIFECLFSSSIFIGSTGNSDENYRAVLDLSGKITDNNIHRVKNAKKYFDVNLVGAMGYNTLNHYTSLISNDYIYSMKKLGFSSYWMEVNSNGGTKFSDYLMGNKYTIKKNSDLYKDEKFIYFNDEYTIAENSLNETFGIIFSSLDISSLRTIPEQSRIKIQDYIFQSLYNTNNSLIMEYKAVDKNNLALYGDTPIILNTSSENPIELFYYCHVNGTQTLYFDCFHEISTNLVEAINGSVNIYVNGRLIESKYPSQRNNGLLELGTFKNQLVSVRVELLKPSIVANSFGVFGIQEDVFKKMTQNRDPVLFQQRKNTLYGEVTAESDQQYLFVPLINQKGYQVTVNLKPVDIYTIFDSFMAIPLEKGSNKIEIRYIPSGFILGIILSILGILSLVGILLFLHFNPFFYFRILENISCILFYSVSGVVGFFIYVFPIIIFFIF